MTDNTQELDDAPDLSDTHVLVDVPGFGKVWAVNYIHGYYNTWLDWHNKQVEEVMAKFHLKKGVKYDVKASDSVIVITHSNKLKENK